MFQPFVSTNRFISFVLFFLLVVIWMVDAGSVSAKVFQSNVKPTKTPAQLVAAPTNTAQLNTPTILDEKAIEQRLDELIGIDKQSLDAVKNQENPKWFARVDKVFDSSLAATLAGLALAAAAFLFSFGQRIEDEFEENKRNYNPHGVSENGETEKFIETAKKITKRLNDAEIATVHMIKAFFFFVVVLITSLTIDTQTDGGNGWTWQFTTDFILSISGMTFGITRMSLGARQLLNIIKESMRNKTDNDGAGTVNSSPTPKTGSGADENKPGVARRIITGVYHFFMKLM